jgi:hypothetical protein
VVRTECLNINNPLKPSGHYMYRQFNIQQFYVLCVLCGSENKQRLFPYTALTDWTDCVYCTVRTGLRLMLVFEVFYVYVCINNEVISAFIWPTLCLLVVTNPDLLCLFLSRRCEARSQNCERKTTISIVKPVRLSAVQQLGSN